MSTPQLLPCPFCGHDTPEFERLGTPRQSCIVICGDCGARHESSDEGDRCGRSWNERAPLAAQGQTQPAAPQAVPAVQPISRDALIETIAAGLSGTLHCGRVWSAWQVGTMTEDDFYPVDESDTPVEIADAVMALLASRPQAEPTKDTE